MTRIVHAVILATALPLTLAWLAPAQANPSTPPAVGPRAQLKATAAAVPAAVPLAFEENLGQTDARVEYLARGRGYTLFLTPTEAVLRLSASTGTGRPSRPDVLGQERTLTTATLRMKLAGVRSRPGITGVDRLPGVVNSFVGNDPRKWRVAIPTYRRVRYEGVYPGIDLVYYGNQGLLEYDFVVAAGADPAMIGLDFEGATALRLDGDGNLIASVDGGHVILRAPRVYQELAGELREIDGGYVVSDTGRVSFRLAAYDRARPLVIDPILQYSTFLGGSLSDGAHDIAADDNGYMYVTGYTLSPAFPTTTGVPETYLAFDSSHNGDLDVFVSKIFGSTGLLVYSTFLGGANRDIGRAIALHANGNFSVTGETRSPDFPTTALDTSVPILQAHDSLLNSPLCAPGVDCPDPGATPASDAFVAQFRGWDGKLVYSTFLGGSGSDFGFDVAVNGDDNSIAITGVTYSSDFPTTESGELTVKSTYPHYFGGGDAFLALLVVSTASTNTGYLRYSTFLGGSSEDIGLGIALGEDPEELPHISAYVTGVTYSADFAIGPQIPPLEGSHDPTYNGAGDAFVHKISLSAQPFTRYHSYLGGSGHDEGYAIALGGVPADLMNLTGFTESEDFPSDVGYPYDGSIPGGFVAVISTEAEMYTWSFVIPDGVGTDIVRVGAPSYDIYVSGYADSALFPTTDGSDGTIEALDQTPPAPGTTDAFVMRLDGFPPPLFSTFLGGSGNDWGMGIAVRGPSVYVAGQTQSADFPTTDGSGGTTQAQDPVFNGETDAFVSRIDFILPFPGIAPALKAKLLFPFPGAVTDPTPAFKWRAAPEGTWYHLRVDDSERHGKIKAWFRASDVCRGDLCAVALPASLAEGPATWRVLTQKSQGRKVGHVGAEAGPGGAPRSRNGAEARQDTRGGHWSEPVSFTVLGSP